jgi:hypothetical protein
MVPNDKHGIGNQIDGYYSFPKCQSTLDMIMILLERLFLLYVRKVRVYSRKDASTATMHVSALWF